MPLPSLRSGARTVLPRLSSVQFRCAGLTTSARVAAGRYRRWDDDVRLPPRRAESRWGDESFEQQMRQLQHMQRSQQMSTRQERRRWQEAPYDESRLAYLWARTPRWFLVLLGVGGAYYVAHLEQVPGTGRWRFIDVTPVQDLKMGQGAYEETMQQYAGAILPNWHPTSRRVHRVANRLVQAIARHPDAAARANSDLWSNWDVHVIESDETNAFVLPGGHIFVFTGILPVAQTDDGLAAVLGHEMSHQLARHSAEKMSRMKVLLVLGWGLAATLGWDPGLTRLGTQVALELPNSRKMESEADFLGLRLMAAACYDPSAAEGLWSRMDRLEEHNGVSDTLERVLSTHPVSSDRMKAMHQAVPDAMQIRQEAGCPPLGQATFDSPNFSSILGFNKRPRP